MCKYLAHRDTKKLLYVLYYFLQCVCVYSEMGFDVY